MDRDRPEDEDEGWLSRGAFATAHGIDTTTVWRWAKAGLVETRPHGRRNQYKANQHTPRTATSTSAPPVPSPLVAESAPTNAVHNTDHDGHRRWVQPPQPRVQPPKVVRLSAGRPPFPEPGGIVQALLDGLRIADELVGELGTSDTEPRRRAKPKSKAGDGLSVGDCALVVVPAAGITWLAVEDAKRRRRQQRTLMNPRLPPTGRR